ncbi:MAG: Spy/CpxP family protein refolding chaperone [Myxococcota bacterium]|jgi:Spy/CpxP family protein refolding chaperone
MSAIRNIFFAAGFATLGAFAAIGTQAVASGHRGGPFGPNMARLADALDLTDDQQAMVDEMREDARAQMKGHREDREASKAELKTLLSQETMDADVVHGMIDDHIAEMSGFAHDMADQFISLHATLDADQRAALIETVEEAAERHGSRHSERSGERGERGERGE